MKNIRIGTRNSALALWQANEVAQQLENLGYPTEVVPILSTGDKNLSQPLYSMGITGVFTRDLDLALLNKQIDIAVHSLKDVPTLLPEKIVLIAHLERDAHQDVLIRKSTSKDMAFADLKLATSSLRRRAFWAKKFGSQTFFDIRGNIQTRLQKLESENFDATILSLAGIKRMELNIAYEEIPGMISAPSQGVVSIAGHVENPEINELVYKINHLPTQICVEIEREFLKTLEGGCTAPIGAFAELRENKLFFTAEICDLDGSSSVAIQKEIDSIKNEGFGKLFAHEVLENGGTILMQKIKNHWNDR